jgi:hypothetical protein
MIASSSAVMQTNRTSYARMKAISVQTSRCTGKNEGRDARIDDALTMRSKPHDAEEKGEGYAHGFNGQSCDFLRVQTGNGAVPTPIAFACDFRRPGRRR